LQVLGATDSTSAALKTCLRILPLAVSIAPNAETISPLVLGRQKPLDDFNLEGDRSPRKPSVKGPNAHRLSGRPAINPSQSSASLDNIPQSDDHSHTPSKHLDFLIDEVSSWVRGEKERRARRKQRKHAARSSASTTDATSEEPSRRGSESDNSDDLTKLEEILKRTATLEVSQSRKSSLKHKISLKKLHKRKLSTASSDTEYAEGDVLVPSCDAVLDNSKTVAQPGGASESDEDSTQLKNTPSRRDVDAWTSFKFEIVRLTHTLRLKGWRRVPMELSNNITVERLSGALTNAVYVVTPPDELPERPASKEGNTSTATSTHKPPPPKLLLRIYGPQVEHLIDRDSELAILKRLARKRIGPRMLGTFANGRFEEYFHAMPLTPEELRNPDTSRQIAKRMRELHEGIELTDKERNDGPFVWLNWDKWESRVEQVVSWLDREVKSVPPGSKPTGEEAWKRRGFICGVEWSHFQNAVNKYRKWLEEQYGGAQHVKEQLVFAHNDTQYGNILRMVPTGESPLLLPANSHKQLVVIDFEYSNANLPGLEFANHFTEWCYNYHDEKKPYAINIKYYPTPEEQDRFVRAYIRHRPQFNVSTPKMRPQSPPTNEEAAAGPRRTTSSISSFMLDARQPGTSTPTATDESAEKASEDAEVARLLHETRLWRLANTAQWVAWGIVQAKVPGMPEFSGSDGEPAGEPLLEDAGRELLGERAETYEELARTETAGTEEGEHEEDEEFDYLGYAQHRALFFWGDMLQLGLIKEEDVPEDLRVKLKVVPY
jgi:choline kinase